MCLRNVLAGLLAYSGDSALKWGYEASVLKIFVGRLYKL